MEKRTEKIDIRTLPSVKAAVKMLAAKEGRTVSNYIEYLILREFQKEGCKIES